MFYACLLLPSVAHMDAYLDAYDVTDVTSITLSLTMQFFSLPTDWTPQEIRVLILKVHQSTLVNFRGTGQPI